MSSRSKHKTQTKNNSYGFPFFVFEEYGTLRDGSLQSCYSSNTSLDRPWSPTQNTKDDLYSWMAKQHKERKESVSKENTESVIVSTKSILQRS